MLLPRPKPFQRCLHCCPTTKFNFNLCPKPALFRCSFFHPFQGATWIKLEKTVFTGIYWPNVLRYWWLTYAQSYFSFWISLDQFFPHYQHNVLGYGLMRVKRSIFQSWSNLQSSYWHMLLSRSRPFCLCISFSPTTKVWFSHFMVTALPRPSFSRAIWRLHVWTL